ncbi:hypothetical protein B0H10DRAFT_1969488 [Mycena sp. CBHHK59/15]|nr:hypothetical protein B0H10DRAFT_1969488 [Mycena sp. CBHHK59/15]
MNVDEREISDILRSNVALLAFHRDFLTEFLKSRILNSIFGTAVAGRLRKRVDSGLRDTKEAWTTCNSNDLSAFIFEILAQLDVGHVGLADSRKYRNEMPPNSVFTEWFILTEDEISKLKVKEFMNN